MTNWNCPRAVWRIIVLIAFAKQGKEFDCSMFSYDTDLSKIFNWDYRYAKNRSKEIYFWLDSHYQNLGAIRKGLTYQFNKSKLPTNFDSMILKLITT